MNENIENLVSIQETISNSTDIYLSHFGSYVGSQVASILAKRNPNLLKRKYQTDYNNELSDLFKLTFMQFLIKEPYFFKSRMKYPFMDTLVSIDILLKENKHKIIWIEKNLFIDRAYVPTYFLKNIKVPLNVLKSISIPDEYQKRQYSEKEAALAMMDAFDPNTFSIAPNWFEILEIKKQAQDKRHEQLILSIEERFTPIKMKHLFDNLQPMHENFEMVGMAEFEGLMHEIEESSSIITKKRWSDLAGFLILTVFNRLNIKTADKAISSYFKIYTCSAMKDANESWYKDYSFFQSLSKALDGAEKIIKEFQEFYRTRLFIKEGEFTQAFIAGIAKQVNTFKPSNPVLNDAYSSIKINMTKINRITKDLQVRALYEEIFFHEAMTAKLAGFEPKNKALYLRIELEDKGISPLDTAKILHQLYLRGSAVNNPIKDSGLFFEDSYPLTKAFEGAAREKGKVNSREISSAEKPAKTYLFNKIVSYTLDCKNTGLPYMDVDSHKAKVFLKDELRSFALAVEIIDERLLKHIQHLPLIYTKFSLKTHTFPIHLQLEYLNDMVELEEGILLQKLRLFIQDTIDSEEDSSDKKLCLKLELEKLLLTTIYTMQVPNINTLKLENELIDFFKELCVIAEEAIESNFYIFSQIIAALNSVQLALIEEKYFDLLLKLPSISQEANYRTQNGYVNNTNNYIPNKSIKKEFLSEIERLALTFADKEKIAVIHTLSGNGDFKYIVKYCKNLMKVDLKEVIETIAPSHQAGLRRLLKLYFSNNNINVMDYIATCPEWQKEHAMLVYMEAFN